MRRRIWLVGTVMATASLVLGVGFAAAASKSTSTNKVKPITLRCSISMATPPPAGDNTVTQPPLAGTFYGPDHCPTKSFGPGVEAALFTVADSGDTVGTYVQYFNKGSIKGAYDLSPAEGQPPSSTTFDSQAWTGTVTVTGGTGIYKGIKTYKAKHKPVTPGVLNCTSPDSVHLTCTEKVKIVLPATFTP